MTFEEDFERRVRLRLDPLDALGRGPVFNELDPRDPAGLDGAQLRSAAVLAPVVRRPEGYTMLLTLRSADMPSHAGQVAFPGGKVQPEDDGPLATALRETFEETGLSPEYITPLGGFGVYRTGTNFLVTPVVGLVEPGFTLNPDPREVDAVFETPLSFLMDRANHQRHAREWGGRMREYYAMPWEDRYIWGVTAGLIKLLHDRLYESEVE